MTSFVNIHPSTQHLGAARVESALSTARVSPLRMSATRGLSTLLLSAMTTAAMVLAYQIMDTVAEGHLMVIWMALWAVAFGALALFAGAARKMAVALSTALRAWSARSAQSASDRSMWALAQTDSRVLADLQAAVMRADVDAEAQHALDAQYADVRAVAAPLRRPAERSVQFGSMVLRAYQRNYI